MHDLDQDIPLTWWRVFLAVLSYILFFTDVPRSGYGFASMPADYYQVSPTMATFYGPYAYLVILIMRSPDGTWTGKTSSGSTNTTTLWSYKFDTCSMGLRSLVQWFNTPNWPPCVLYKKECDESTLSLEVVMTMLDSFVETIRLEPVTTSFRADCRFDDVLDDLTAFGLVQRKLRRTVEIHYLNETLDICNPAYYPRPQFCEMPWSNLQSLGYEGVRAISTHIQARMKDFMAALNESNQLIDMAIIESTSHQQPWMGSVARPQDSIFDVVTILRVQNCTDINKTNCSTVQVQDFRYEGGFNNTNIPRWYALVKLLRFLGQSYNIIRVFLLIIGCYYARVAEVKYAHAPLHLKVWVTMTTFLRIPAQVVIYGSWFPVVLFVLAHGIDSSELYYSITKSFVGLEGYIQTTPSHLIYLLKMLTCHMRNVWVLCITIKIISFVLQHNLDSSQLLHGLPGVRGYLLSLVSLISVIFDIRSNSFRNADVLSIYPVSTSLDTAIIRHEHPMSDYRASGLYADARNLALSFFAACLLLWLASIRPVLSCTRVPYTILTFCNRTMFSTSWHALLLTTSIKSTRISPHLLSTHSSEHLLMNILWMTDPIEWLFLLWKSPSVYCYCHKLTKTRIYHPLESHDLVQLENFTQLKEEYDCETTVQIASLSWRERIECL